jgi:ubiquinone/menaquinone biosynthesis C-methylase UbiE
MSRYEKNWEDYAREIDERKESAQWEVLRKARETHWHEFFDVGSGDRLLDAGCGHGDYTVLALKSGAQVWAFDFSNEMTRRTAARVDRLGLEARAITRHSVLNIPYPDEMFDQVFCLAVLDHLSASDRKQAMGELKRVLKKGGKLYLDVPNRLAYHWRGAFEIMRLFKLYPAGKIHFFTPGELKGLLRAHGMHMENSIGLTICPPFSGLYTTDIRRVTFLSEPFIRIIDLLYLAVEIRLRRVNFFKPLCWHYFIKALKK